MAFISEINNNHLAQEPVAGTREANCEKSNN